MTSKANPRATMEAVPLPEGFTLQLSEDGSSATLINRHRDGGDVFSLGFLAVVVLLFSLGVGSRAFALPGALGGLALTSPLWGWLALGALARAINHTTVTATPGKLSVKVGPVGSRGSAELVAADVSAIHSKHFENRSSTRGGKLLITKTWSVWARLKDGKELCLAEPLDVEAQAKHIERALKDALAER